MNFLGQFTFKLFSFFTWTSM